MQITAIGLFEISVPYCSLTADVPSRETGKYHAGVMFNHSICFGDDVWLENDFKAWKWSGLY